MDFSGKDRHRLVFMAEGHDVDNADTKWLCPNVIRWTRPGSDLVISARGAGRQRARRGRVGEGLPAPFWAQEARPDRRRVLRSATETAVAAKHIKHVHHHQTARERHKARTAHWERGARDRPSRRIHRLGVTTAPRGNGAAEARATRRDNHGAI